MSAHSMTTVSNDTLEEILMRCHAGQTERQIVDEIRAATGEDSEQIREGIRFCRSSLSALEAGFHEGIRRGVRNAVHSSVDSAFESARERILAVQRERSRRFRRFVAWVCAVIAACLAFVQLLGLIGIVSALGDPEIGKAILGWCAVLIVLTLPFCALTYWLFRRSRRKAGTFDTKEQGTSEQ